jgi:hypothetical protein
MNLLLATDQSVSHAFSTLTAFQSASGSKLNLEKTEGMYYGYQTGRTTGPVPIKWRTDGLEILGTRMTPSLEQDWETPVRKTEQNLQMWKTRKLTIRGRALLAKTYGIATLIYLATCFTIPRRIADRVTRNIFRFIWQNGVEYISRDTLHKCRAEGGLGIPSIKTLSQTVKLKMTLKITDPTNTSTWACWTRYHVGQSLASVTDQWKSLRDNSKPHKDEAWLPEWYQEIHEYTQSHKVDLRDIIESKQRLTTKTLNNLTINTEPVRATKKWEALGITPTQLKTKWTQIWTNLNTREEQELTWRILHWSLPTRNQLSKWNRTSINGTCPFCTATETLSHALIECPRLQTVWNYVNNLIRRLQQPPITTVQAALFPPDDSPLTTYIINTNLYGIWQSRKIKLFANKTPNNLVKTLKERIKSRIRHDQRTQRRTRLENTWGKANVLINYTAKTNELTFNF